MCIIYSKMSKKALLVGINYFKTPNQLNGCINDIMNVRGMLMDAYDYLDSNISLLRDDDPNKMPTRENIINALKTLVANSASCSEIWFHYSGHGTFQTDRNGDESDKRDEALVPCDFSKAGIILDDELFDIIRMARCRMIIMLDCCHSGSGCDLQYAFEYANGTFRKSVNNAKVIANPNIIMMSGCKDVQTSADAFDNNTKEFVGAFTNSLLECLRASQHNIDTMKLYNNICFRLIQSKFTQTPILSSSANIINHKFAKSASNGGSVTSSSIVSAAGKKNLARRKHPFSVMKFTIL
jgi:hypothetical protein